MNLRQVHILALTLFCSLGTVASTFAGGREFVSPGELKQLELQQYWSLRLPLEAGESVNRLALVDDVVYAITSNQRALAVHSRTGVVRWSNFVAEDGQTIRGPSHASKYVFFTAAGSVRVFDRQTGDLAGTPRVLRGVVIEVASEKATISIGEEHGVHIGDVLSVNRSSDFSGTEGYLGKLKITSVQARYSRGQLERAPSAESAKPGDRVQADVMLPLQQVKLPFAASSAAVSDNQWIYVGAANQRFYAVDMLNGIQHWQLLTPGTVSATPVLIKDTLYIAGQDGLVTCCTKEEKAKNWTFQTEAPIFADLVVEGNRVYVSSTDRSLYCLDRHSGKKVWRERFDTPLTASPVVAGGNIYQLVPEQGLVVMDAETGKRAWVRPEGGRFLGVIGDDAYLLATEGSSEILRVNAKNGRKKEEAIALGAEFAIAGLADQSMFLGDINGNLTCLRPIHAPHLRPEQLQEALKSDRKIQSTAEFDAQAKAAVKKKPAEPAPKSRFEDDDGLASRSTAAPVGGHGLLTPKDKGAAAPKKEEAKPDEGEKTEKTEGAEEGDKKEEGEAKEGEEKSSDEKSADDDDADDKAKEGESKGEDEKEEGDDEKKDEGDKEKPDEKP